MYTGLQRRFVPTLIRVTSIQFLQQIQLSSLLAASDLVIPDILDQLFNLPVPGVDVRSLVDTGQE
jgi:hypothetical protein